MTSTSLTTSTGTSFTTSTVSVTTCGSEPQATTATATIEITNERNNNFARFIFCPP